MSVNSLEKCADKLQIGADKSVSRFWRLPENKNRKFEGGRRLTYRCEDRPSQFKDDLVSIVTVCFNAEQTIAQTIESVLNQTHRNIEYIIIDGNSSDNTLDVVRRYEYNIDYIISEPDQGLYYAMNKGISLATGRYIIFVNADDWYELDTIESLLQASRASNASFVSACARKIGANGEDLGVLGHMPYDESMNFGMSIRHELMLLPAKIYQEIGVYDESYRIISDFEFAMRLYTAGYSFYEIPRPLLNFRVTGVSNNDFEKVENEHQRLVQGYFPFLLEEDLKIVANEQKITAEKIYSLVNRYPLKHDFVNALLAYGRRRFLYLESLAEVEKELPFPDISIIIPVYNASGSISRALDSVLAEKSLSLEIICIDDCSRDNSLQILKDYAKKDPRIKILVNEQNQGVSSTRNNGIIEATGKFIFFLDADDRIAPGGLQALHSLTCDYRYNPEIVRGNVEFIKHDGSTHIKGYHVKEPVAHTTAWSDQSLTRTTEGFFGCLYKSSVVKNILFRTNLKMGEDSLFFVTALLSANSISLTSSIVYEYIDTEGSAMNSYDLKKFSDELEWRLGAFYLLQSAGLYDNALFLVKDYWNEEAFSKLRTTLTHEEFEHFANQYRYFVSSTKVQPHLSSSSIPKTCEIFREILQESSDKQDSHHKRNALRIAILTSAAGGGAGIAAKRLFNAAYSEPWFKPSFYTRSNVHIFSPVAPQDRVTNGSATNTWFSVCLEDAACATPSEKDFILSLSQYDVINIHWTSDFTSINFLDELSMTGVPILLTMHDYWYLTGGCHYPAGCTRFYEYGCHSCPQSIQDDEKLQHVIHDTHQRKIEILSRPNVFISAPSSFLLSEAAKALGLPTNHGKFFLLRNPLLPQLPLKVSSSNTLSFLLICDTHNEKRKGLGIAIEVFAKLSKVHPQFKLNIVGAIDEETKIKLHEEVNADISVHGRISEISKLEEVFQQNDFVVQSSFEDNWSNILVEAGIHGCLPITLPCHGSEEFVNIYSPLKLVASSLSSDALFEKLKAALDIPLDQLRNAQQEMANHVRRDHHPQKISQRYFSGLVNMMNMLDFRYNTTALTSYKPRVPSFENRKIDEAYDLIKFNSIIDRIVAKSPFLLSSTDLSLLSSALNLLLMNKNMDFSIAVNKHSGAETINNDDIEVLMLEKGTFQKVTKETIKCQEYGEKNKYSAEKSSSIVIRLSKPRHSHYGFPLLRCAVF